MREWQLQGGRNAYLAGKKAVDSHVLRMRFVPNSEQRQAACGVGRPHHDLPLPAVPLVQRHQLFLIGNSVRQQVESAAES